MTVESTCSKVVIVTGGSRGLNAMPRPTEWRRAS